ncbi:MAG: hypothetical protein A2010_14285 [Nitrospirae bacterium GWD2_57_9]|nr:MAG: hypothetical protein A2010_14285 [Nitrospirae bacterium GWD2_57_9]OGW46041.1 MAG: hypothetical protein A2078_11790 [Nitrospirae bacterium GWC2_57_9]
MRYVLVFVLVIVASTATVAYGGKKNNPSRETTLLASEVAGKIVSRPGTTVSVTAPDSCRLHISFESVNASFDLPLQGSTVSLADAEDGLIVENKSMTRKIKDRAPEAFERLTLRFNRTTVKSVMKTFSDAIASCNANVPSVVAVN